MPSCAVSNCNNSSRKKDSNDIKFYRLPKNPDLALQWVQACGRQDKINMKYAVICSKHFENKYFFRSYKYVLLNKDHPKTFRNLLEEAIPTLHLPTMQKLKQQSGKRIVKVEPENNFENTVQDNGVKNLITFDSLQSLANSLRKEQTKNRSLEVEVIKLKSENMVLKNEKSEMEAELFRLKTTFTLFMTKSSQLLQVKPK